MGNSRKILELRSLVFFYNPIDFVKCKWLANQFWSCVTFIGRENLWQFLNFPWELIIDHGILYRFSLIFVFTFIIIIIELYQCRIVLTQSKVRDPLQILPPIFRHKVSITRTPIRWNRS